MSVKCLTMGPVLVCSLMACSAHALCAMLQVAVQHLLLTPSPRMPYLKGPRMRSMTPCCSSRMRGWATWSSQHMMQHWMSSLPRCDSVSAQWLAYKLCCSTTCHAVVQHKCYVCRLPGLDVAQRSLWLSVLLPNCLSTGQLILKVSIASSFHISYLLCCMLAAGKMVIC